MQDEVERALKRRKVLSDHIDLSKGESAELTTEHGLKLVDTLRRTEDKRQASSFSYDIHHLRNCTTTTLRFSTNLTYSGRRIATSFLTLPDRKLLPDYYDVTEMPIALDTIEERLRRHEFDTLEQLESYFKRMIANAKDYNQRGSEVYDDSERLRKALSNVMVKINPAYQNPGYSAYPTPLPSDSKSGSKSVSKPTPKPAPKVTLKVSAPPPPIVDEDAEGELDDEDQTPIKRGRGRPPKDPRALQAKSATPSEYRYSGVGFEALSFQQAQEKILEDLITRKDNPDDEIASFEVFFDKPDKKLYPDYYKLIKNVVSLKSVQSKIKRSSGDKDAPTISEFKSWGAFEHEMNYLWNNAWQFNEDGSEISTLATELQTAFQKLLQEAKKSIHVQEPANKIRLKMPEPAPKITLKLGGRPSPADSPAPQTNGSNGATLNGAPRKNPFVGSVSGATPLPNLDPLERAKSMSDSAASPTPSNSAAVKSEEVAHKSPAIQTANYNNYRPLSQPVSTPGPLGNGMLPPSTPGIPTPNLFNSGGYAQSFQHPTMFQAPNPAVDNKWRPEGQTADDAMITNLLISTHPGLNIARHFRMEVTPSDVLAQQSITINLPPTHYYLQIKPTIADFLVQPDRQHRIFVTAGTQRLFALPIIPNHPIDQRHPLFDARLLPGVNRIEIEIIANLPRNSPKPANGTEMVKEKITIFANLLKQ
ncbi:Protein polybromo-1 [Lachnellula hyalina]|uniref:Protein polybromo-1 n=1 Tax=Lachnellula hyalina TaxID=1316788 RepID=A0A8H8U3F1_9HELO|nr:Protein polybromo-1 [Lachnellula hyalina]TVY29978.1 Protein polybromo-1 [Lachnellula hyalina]